jgi:hypothetical protein
MTNQHLKTFSVFYESHVFSNTSIDSYPEPENPVHAIPPDL